MENVKKLIVDYSKKVYNQELTPGKSGNISIKFTGENGKELIAITPTLLSLGTLKEDDVAIVDMNGNTIGENKPSSEVYMHCYIYKKREDIKAIVHTHSPYATGFAHSHKKIKRYEGFGPINIPYLSEIEYIKPGTDELAKSVGEAFSKSKNMDVLILKEHGIITTGINLDEATDLAEFVEYSAKTQFITNMLNSI